MTTDSECLKANELHELAEGWLRLNYPTSHIVHEMTVGSWGTALIDVAAICDDKIVGVEIKGVGDSPSRLKLQGNMYSRCCRRVFLLSCPSISDRIQKHRPLEWLPLFYENINQEILPRFKGRGEGTGLAPAALAGLIWSRELGLFLRRLYDQNNETGLAKIVGSKSNFCAAVVLSLIHI